MDDNNAWLSLLKQMSGAAVNRVYDGIYTGEVTDCGSDSAR